jgi:hypothetical protein
LLPLAYLVIWAASNLDIFRSRYKILDLTLFWQDQVERGWMRWSVSEWAMLVPAWLRFTLLAGTALSATKNGFRVAFFAVILGSKYQMYAETYRGRVNVRRNRAFTAMHAYPCFK